jgi:hypothetical protein
MRRRRLGGMASALLMGLAAAVATARGGEYVEDNSPQAEGLLSGLFHEKPRKQTKDGPNAKNTKNVQKTGEIQPRPVAAGASGSVESAIVEQQRRQNALIRRMEVCDRLRIIANQTGNEALMMQANELEERANAIYRQQTASLPLPAQTPLSILADENHVAPGLPGEQSPASRGQYSQFEPRTIDLGAKGGH